jgi:HlyD family secretion protein
MKPLFFAATIITVFFASCSGDKDKPDAYGTFEATEVTVSSQANGKILWLTIDEGQVVDSGMLIGLVDTLDLSLKKAQAGTATGDFSEKRGSCITDRSAGTE